MRPESTEDVLALLDSCFTAASVGAAMEFGLFWMLENEPMDAAAVAGKLGIPGHRCRYWLDILARAGLLEEGPRGFAPTAEARSTIIGGYSKETWALLAQEARGRSPALRDLPYYLPLPVSAWAAQGLERPSFYKTLRENKEIARRFTRMLYEIHGPFAERLAGLLDFSSAKRIMDLGGGSGVVSFALLRRYGGLSSTVVDMEPVCEVGREIAEEIGMSGRITYHPADFLKDELPGGFDAVIECDVDVYDDVLLGKVWRSLEKGGRFVIVDQLAPAVGLAPPARICWAFDCSMDAPDFRYPTAEEVRAGLVDAGFEVLFVGQLPAEKERGDIRFDRAWTWIDARKL
jgi:SAM-dependent methyltransferase